MTDTPRTTMPITEKIGLGITLVIAIILIGYSVFSLLIDVILKFDKSGIVIDLILLAIGIALGYFSIRIYKKSVYYESLVNSAFDNGVYRRLEPVLRKVAEAHTEMEGLESRLNIIDRKVQTVIDEQVKSEPRLEVETAIAPGTSMGFIIKTIFLAIITMSGFLFMLYTSVGYSHFAALLFFFLWWLLISYEFKLFNNTAAWVIAFLPLLLVPVSFMILGYFIDPNNLVALFYLFLALYVFLYFSWAVYETKGTLPFNLNIGRYFKQK
ncbi:MAG TPA: hypothetical protein EYP28_06525 [Methanophagales archaeon]|nr:hypothetical protein [Methanophagales archaeon]